MVLKNDIVKKTGNSNNKSKLIDIAKAEYQEFIEFLRQRSANEIIDAAYKITVMEDILSVIESGVLRNKDIDALLTLKRPLDCIYTEWLSNDYSLLNLIVSTINDVTSDLKIQTVHRNFEQLHEEPTIGADEYISTYEANDEEELEL